MGEKFYRLVELIFTAYAVPALIVPFVWLARRLLRGRGAAPQESAERLNRAAAIYGLVSVMWIGAWVVLVLEAGIE